MLARSIIGTSKMMSVSSLLKVIPFPPLLFAAAVSATVLLAFAIWILVDASFQGVLEVALIDLRIHPHPGIDLSSAHGWNELGPRLLVFGGLAIVAVFYTAVVGVRLFVGNPSGRTIASMLLATALVAGWFGLFAGYDGLHWWGFRFRLWCQLTRFEHAANELAENWPDEDGVHPVLGAYKIDQQYPHLLVVRSGYEGHPFQEKIGLFVRRTPDGNLRFDLATSLDHKLEFYPHGGQPESFTDNFGDFTVKYRLIRVRRLQDSTYLTTYSQTNDLFDAP